MRINPICNQAFTAKTFYTFDSPNDRDKYLRGLTRRSMMPEENGKLNGVVYRHDEGILYLTEQDRMEFLDKVSKDGTNLRDLVEAYVNDPETKRTHIKRLK